MRANRCSATRLFDSRPLAAAWTNGQVDGLMTRRARVRISPLQLAKIKIAFDSVASLLFKPGVLIEAAKTILECISLLIGIAGAIWAAIAALKKKNRFVYSQFT